MSLAGFRAFFILPFEVFVATVICEEGDVVAMSACVELNRISLTSSGNSPFKFTLTKSVTAVLSLSSGAPAKMS